MMIDRKTALVGAALIALMLAAAVARIIFVHGPPIPADQEARLLWEIFLLPISPALLVVSLYANGRRAIAAGAKLPQQSYDWGKRLTIGSCTAILLIQGLAVLQSLGFQLPVLTSAVGRATAVAMTILVLLAINQMPKLPWFGAAGKLGPIYGPRFMRANARIWLVCLVVLVPCIFALPKQAWLCVLFAMGSALAWTTALRLNYRRRWKLEQSTASEVTP